MKNKVMNIENLDETLVQFINDYFPDLNWNGEDSSADAELLLDEYSTIEDGLMWRIVKAMMSIKDEEFTLSIRPSENKLILYYID